MSSNGWGILITAMLAVIIWQNWQASQERAYIARVADHVDATTAAIATRQMQQAAGQ